MDKKNKEVKLNPEGGEINLDKELLTLTHSQEQQPIGRKKLRHCNRVCGVEL